MIDKRRSLMEVIPVSGALDDSKWKGLRRLKLFFALSRTPHGILDMATPGLAALLWLGTFPDFSTVLLGLITVFAGYTSVYALNDVVDMRADREKIQQGGFQDSGNYLDGAILRHPLAHGLLRFNQALLWVVSWGLIALVGAYLLNPFCVVVFAAGCALEMVYCFMWKISPFRIFISGVVKTCGPVAAILAVDPKPSPGLLAIIFLWLFFWEMGGQNIPNDWAEIDEDRMSEARTIIVSYGPLEASLLALGCLCLTVMVSFFLFFQRQGHIPAGAALLIGFFLLLEPAFNLFRKRTRSQALVLFNRASYYPLSLLIIVGLNTLLFLD
jgi:4-hydroxybenzoate polyprenyltransferase